MNNQDHDGRKGEVWGHPCKGCGFSIDKRAERCVLCEIADLRTKLNTLQVENERLENLAYVPGVTRCAKCNFRLISTKLNVTTGQASANSEPQQCLNGCGPMWKITEREAGNEAIDQLEAALTRASESEARELELREALEAELAKYQDVCAEDECSLSRAEHDPVEDFVPHPCVARILKALSPNPRIKGES